MYSYGSKYKKKKIKTMNIKMAIAGQDGGVGRYALPSRTTKRRTTNWKTINNEHCQKIKLYGCLTTKELKKKHSFRLGGRGREDTRQGGGWMSEQSHIHVPLNWGWTNGEQDRPHNLGFQHGKWSLKTSVGDNLWGLRQWEKLPASKKSLLERPTGT